MANHRQNYVLTSIRNPFEVEALQNSGGFILVAITAPIELRFARIIARHRNQEETMTLEEFKRYEEKELQSASSVEQQLNECVKIARFTISNDTDLISFEQKIEQILSKNFRNQLYCAFSIIILLPISFPLSPILFESSDNKCYISKLSI